MQDPQYHKNEHLKSRCLKVADGLKSSQTISNVGVGAMVRVLPAKTGKFYSLTNDLK